MAQHLFGSSLDIILEGKGLLVAGDQFGGAIFLTDRHIGLAANISHECIIAIAGTPIKKWEGCQ